MPEDMCRRCDRMIIFDDAWSFIHFVLGMLTKFLATTGLWLLALAIFITFVIWETIEQERHYYKLADFIEYILGYMLTEIILEIDL